MCAYVRVRVCVCVRRCVCVCRKVTRKTVVWASLQCLEV